MLRRQLSARRQVAIAADAALSGVALELSARVLAILIGAAKPESKQLVGQAQRARVELDRRHKLRARQEGFTQRAEHRWQKVFADVTWPKQIGDLPSREEITPLRSPTDQEGPHRGTWRSLKLDRDVEFESSSELMVIQTLDHAESILWYCEQAIRIPYAFDQRQRTYYPDLLVVTTDRRCVLVEVKPVFDMALAVNRAKTAAAIGFCQRRGWGYLVTDGYRTLRQLTERPIAPEHEQLVRTRMSEAGGLTYRDLKELQATHGIATLDVTAMVIRYDWNLRLAPFQLDDGKAQHGAAARDRARPRD